MSKKRNALFLVRYMELDKLCCEKFGVSEGNGVIEYINRLSNAKTAAGRDEVLSHLIGYSNAYKRFHHNPRALQTDHTVTRHDITWIIRFRSQIERKRDPITRYLKHERRYAIRRKVNVALWCIFLAALAVAIIALSLSA